MATQAQAHPLAERPDHVPESLVYAFDMFNDPEYLADPHEKILRLHKEAPAVFWTPYNGGVWMLLSYEANFTAMRDPALFSSQMFNPEMQKLIDQYLSQRERRVPRPVPISLDPPEHGIYRDPLHAYFAPRKMMAMRGKIRALAGDLIEVVRPQGQCELMSTIAEPLPITVFLELLGLPVDQKSIYLPLAQAHFDALENEPHRLADYQVEVAELMKQTVEDRRINPRDDLLSALWKMEFGGRPATADDIEDLCAILFLGGLDTVMNGIGFAAVHLARDLALQCQLREDPSLIPGAVEEMLRRFSFALPLRRATADTTLEGAFMKAGDRMVTFLPGANLDPSKFPEPERYDLSRETNAHIVFGAGAAPLRGRASRQDRIAGVLRGIARAAARVPPRSHENAVLSWRPHHAAERSLPRVGGSVDEFSQSFDAGPEFVLRNAAHLGNEHGVDHVHHVLAELVALSRQFEPDDAPVLGIGLAQDEPCLDQSIHFQGHRAGDGIEIVDQQTWPVQTGVDQRQGEYPPGRQLDPAR